MPPCTLLAQLGWVRAACMGGVGRGAAAPVSWLSPVIRVAAADVSRCGLGAPEGPPPENGALVPRRGGFLGRGEH